MKITPSEIRLNIIYLILMYQKTRDKRYKEAALSDLNDLLVYYGTPKRILPKIDLNEALIKFCDNRKGIDSINILRNSI